MNKVFLMGRFTYDPELKDSSNGSYLRANIAVDRRYKSGETTADFPDLVAFGKTAEFISKYFTKGMKILITGRLQTSTYEKDGNKIKRTEVIVDEAEFAESKRNDFVQEGTVDGFVQAENTAFDF